MKINASNFNKTFYNYFFNNIMNNKELYEKLKTAEDNNSRYIKFGNFF